MSNEASAWFQEQWNANVIMVYQQKGYITKGMTTGPTKVMGKKMHFPIAGKGEASQFTPGDEVKAMNAVRGEVLLDAVEFDAADWIRQSDLDRMQPNEVDVVRSTAAAALGRKHDTVLFDLFRAANYAAAPTAAQGFTLGAYGDTALPGPAMLLNARANLFEADVPIEEGGIFCGMPPKVFDNMMSYKAFSDGQWVGGDMPFAGNVRKRSWQNINFFELPTFLQTRPAAGQGRFFMWHQSAAGSGYTGEPLRTEFEKHVRLKRWWYQSTLSAGVCVLQANGIHEIRYNTTLNPTFVQ